MYIFLLVLGGGQDKPAWTACPPGGEDNQGGGQDIPGQLAPRGGKPTAVSLPPGGQAVQGGKINWDTGTDIVDVNIVDIIVVSCRLNVGCHYTIIDFNEVDIRIYLPEKVIIHRGR